MHEGTDWTRSEEVESVRRSIALLPPHAWAMNREATLRALDELLTHLRTDDDRTVVPFRPRPAGRRPIGRPGRRQAGTPPEAA